MTVLEGAKECPNNDHGYPHMNVCSFIKSNTRQLFHLRSPLFLKYTFPEVAYQCLTRVMYHTTWVLCYYSETLSTQLPIENRALLKVGFRMRASTDTALRAYGQLSQLRWFIRTFRWELIPYLVKKFHQPQRLLLQFLG